MVTRTGFCAENSGRELLSQTVKLLAHVLGYAKRDSKG
jgi:hypothetical protein